MAGVEAEFKVPKSAKEQEPTWLLSKSKANRIATAPTSSRESMKRMGAPGRGDNPSQRIMTAPPRLITSHAIRKDIASWNPNTPIAPSSVKPSPASQRFLAEGDDALVWSAAAKRAGKSPKSINQRAPVLSRKCTAVSLRWMPSETLTGFPRIPMRQATMPGRNRAQCQLGRRSHEAREGKPQRKARAEP